MVSTSTWLSVYSSKDEEQWNRNIEKKVKVHAAKGKEFMVFRPMNNFAPCALFFICSHRLAM